MDRMEQLARIHKHENAWAFWTEDGRDRIGYFVSQFAAEIGMEIYDQRDVVKEPESTLTIIDDRSLDNGTEDPI